MKHPLVGIGAAGIVSTVAFTLFILPESPNFEMNDVLDTTVLLGLAFAAVLAVGLTKMANNLRRRDNRTPSPTNWSTKCPECGRHIARRTTFCPSCGADLRYHDDLTRTVSVTESSAEEDRFS
jgi:hypothetical protein